MSATYRLTQMFSLIALAVLAGCATGPRFDTVQSGLSPVPAGQARVYFYRSTALGAAIQPDVTLNGTVVGKAEPNGIFFIDTRPGSMEVVTGSEVEKKLTFTAGAGDTRYVKLAVGLGVLVYRIYPELVSEEEARKETAELAFTGGNRKPQ